MRLGTSGSKGTRLTTRGAAEELDPLSVWLTIGGIR